MFKIRYWSFSVTLHFLLDNSEVQLPQNFIHYFTIAEKAVGNDISQHCMVTVLASGSRNVLLN